MERLHKIMARAGVASRRRCEELISAGQVRVNGKVITGLGTKADPDRDSITVAGKPLSRWQHKLYIILNKPRGYVTTLNDEKGRKKVADLLTKINERVYPVGRLDYDSEGLLLLTNDGDLTYLLTHPKYRVPKTYLARVKGIPGPEKLALMADGLCLEDGITAPARVRLVEDGGENALLEIVIHEGRNRQVRRMCEHIGHQVLRLKRTRYGRLSLGNLPPGHYRMLTGYELRLLKQDAGLAKQEGI